MKKSHPQPAPQNPQPQSQAPLYAKVNKPPKEQRTSPQYTLQQPPETVYAPKKPLDQQNLGASNVEDLYARVNKPPKEQRTSPQYTLQQPSETAYAPKKPLDQQNLGASNVEDLYARVNKPPKEQRTPPQYTLQQPSETAYAPQKPLGNPYDRLGERPSDGRRTDKLVNPYSITDLAAQNWQTPYDTVGGGAQGGRHPQEPEHLYAELDFGANGGRSPQRSLESVYTTVGMGAEGGQESEQLENPIYLGVGGNRISPPRTPKDVVTTRLLQNTSFQYGVREIQERCKVVYGKEHALNGPLAKILDDPQNAEQILWDLAENPQSAGKLAGHKILGVKSPSRREAEDEFTHLCSALERHIHTAQKLHKQFTREQERERGQKQENPEREAEHRHHHHHHHHARGQEQNSPEYSPQRQRHGEKGMAFAM
ncbi:BID domain-containing T4SS effector [Bartonella sp. AP36NXGY]|uniref:BID domain-containing T4SS effector n=1 Tax=Bartonella sp. AP36NXGY TaxID=3243493 RepID=UPI0035CF3E2B